MVKKKTPPSRKRYDAKHPVLSIRTTDDMMKIIENYRLCSEEDKSNVEIVKEGLKNKVSELEAWTKGYELGNKKGYFEGLKRALELSEKLEKLRIWYYCSVCGEKIIMHPNRDDHKAMIQYMREHDWRHAQCK